ncbi:TonB-dependent receptor [Hymenobacter canadensis]|uniref:TonB-dependent receptor n=1 Tax=Hymenobacter canadensis TaxID=2999067 RepID=A0ABY7LVL6_9BACT|nr:TonB-dependent receptor [Hymenobacter canadensis]WBA44111.1 TonB-dependent receptor [Hymenobacter canadensis]
MSAIRTLHLALLLTSPGLAAAQAPAVNIQQTSEVVTGRISDQNNTPVANVLVAVENTFYSALSDAEGRFSLRIRLDGPEPARLVLTRAGFTSQVFELPRQGAGQELQLVLAAAGAADRGEVTTAASRKPENVLRVPVTLDHVGEQRLADSPTPEVYGTLTHLKSVDGNAASMLLTNLSTRGFNALQTTRTLQLVDYVDVQSPSLSANLGNLQGLPEIDIAGVDVLHGPASALYGVNALSGVVLINSKDAFQYPGLAVEIRGGSRSMLQGQLRYAQRLGDKLALKVTGSAFQANDWLAASDEAQSLLVDPTNNSRQDVRGYNAVNRYGDIGNTFRSGALAGQTIYMPGWTEKEIVARDDRARNFRLNPSLAYLLTPRVKALYEYRFTRSDAAFQSASRFRVKQADTHLHHLELNGGSWFLRAYSSQDQGGDTYDMSLLGAYMQTSVDPRTGPAQLSYAQQYFGIYEQVYTQFLTASPGNVTGAHQAAKSATASLQLTPGAEEFNAVRSRVAGTSLPGQGARIDAASSIRNVSGQYTVPVRFADVLVGAEYRQFRLGSEGGNLFAQSSPEEKIRNYQYSGYGQATRTLLDRHLRLALAARVDAFRNFNTVVSPRASAVVSAGEQRQHNFRGSLGQAYSAPTQLYQYSRLDVGQAILLGNVGRGFDGYSLDVLTPGVDPATTLVRLDALDLERVQTAEVGYHGLLGQRLTLDVSYYYNHYRNLVGIRNLISKTDGSRPSPAELATLNQPGSPVRVVQTAYSISGTTGSGGAVADLTLAIAKPLAVNANYTYSFLDETPAGELSYFNTPKHKYNLGLRGETGRLRYSMDYRWVQGFRYETPFALGNVPTYSSLDASVAYTLGKSGLTLRGGGTNLADVHQVQIYGGPDLGRQVYMGLRLEVR